MKDKFKASFNDPFKDDIIELGEIDQDKIIDFFEEIPWLKLIKKITKENENTINGSFSLNISNIKNKTALEMTMVDEDYWYIFFIRPKQVKFIFGLIERISNQMNEIEGQTDDVRTYLKAFINNDLKFLEKMINK